MATATEPQHLNDAIVAFSLEGRFPDDISSLPPVSDLDLQPTIESLAKAKRDLETEIHKINEETKDDVSSWAHNAKVLQADIIRSKTIANEIVRQSEAPDVSGEAIDDAEKKTQFLLRELQYSQQINAALAKIKSLSQLLAQVEVERNERRILNSLRLLECSWNAIDEVGVSKTCRIVKLLDHRAFDLKSSIHEVFNNIWKELVHFSVENGEVIIRESLPEGGMTLSEAVIVLKVYKETDERMEQLWRNLDGAVISPRMKQSGQNTAGVNVNGDKLELTGLSDGSVTSLLSDLEAVMVFVSQKLPKGLLSTLGGFMMADLIPRLIGQWLNPAVPSSLSEVPKFQSIMQSAQNFCGTLEANDYAGFDVLKDWVTKAHMTWLGRYRETSLDTVRRKLAHGIGAPRQVERVERHMVTVSEGKELATTGAGATADTNDWGAAWDDAWDDDNKETTTKTEPNTNPPSKLVAKDDDDGGADAWDWDDEGGADQPPEESNQNKDAGQDEEDTGADAWGWADEDTTVRPEQANTSSPKIRKAKTVHEEKKELIFREKYYISSMPDPILELITATLEDGAALTEESDTHQIIASTAPGLFSLPTLALALFRAISPYYYSLVDGGNMYLYNDAMYIAEQLSKFSDAWKQRQDITTRARHMLRLDIDVKTLQNFANRSYANEMNIQRTVLQDLLGTSQSMMQQDEPASAIEAGTTRIRSIATMWEDILPRSVWSQAIGSLVDALASRIITDVLEMSSIGQDEAYSIANLIVTTTTLDDLFLPSKLGGTEPNRNEVSTTEQYAPNWPRLKYLSEILQSDLNGIRALWCEQKLSYYFTVEEVVDLIHASFEDNPRTRQTIKDIQNTNYPAVDL
ncbi:ribosome biogenesis protein ytm1 [Conoideocrella luteorostrata]|uniref:Ribosome biogenesis protein ytm1 n=1 Tax=Conoideocrella luteorostrata TaxID=1105319 RepID=A0AAJ0CUN4_9HYPO|nr:ribosome biogenesis protein ytm1 [Conoideocrella luteorostrata]